MADRSFNIVSLRRFSFLDSIFGHNLGDGGAQVLDFIVVPLGITICLILAAAVGFMWTKRNVSFMRVKSMRFVILQTFGGIMWYLGFVVRFGHFPRTGILHSCSFWNFHVSIVCGFMIWAACILFRLLRLHLLFNHGVSSIWGISLTNNPFSIISLLCIPHIVIYGALLPILGAVVRREVTSQCLYHSGFWAWSDNILFFSVWVLLLVLSTFVKGIKDGYGEARNLGQALNLALYTLAMTVVVELLQIDGLALGRAVVTSSVLASVCIFFVRQNGEELARLLMNKATLEYVQQDQAIHDAILREDNGGAESDALESSTFCSEDGEGMRKRGSKLSSVAKTQLFAHTLLNNN